MTRREDPVVIAIADGPWGPVRIAATARGLASLSVQEPADSFVDGLRRRGLGEPVDLGAAPPGPAAELAARARHLVERHLAGEAVPLETLPVDLEGRSAWDRLVLGAVRTIPRGEVASYGEIARRIGRAGAARAVGGAVGRNPVGLAIPCHRVIAGDGSLGGYGVAAYGGVEAALAIKRELLAIEGVRLGRVGKATSAV